MKCRYCHGELDYAKTEAKNDFGDKIYRLDIVCTGNCQTVWRDKEILKQAEDARLKLFPTYDYLLSEAIHIACRKKSIDIRKHYVGVIRELNELRRDFITPK